MTDATSKPRFKLVQGQPMPATKLGMARLKFGRDFAHQPEGNFLRNPEHVLTRWGRSADYFNCDPHKARPAGTQPHYKARK